MKKLFTSCVICILLSACATKEPSYKKYIDHESTLFEKVVFENPVILGFGEFMTDIGSKTAYLSDIIMLPEQITFDNKTFSSRHYVAPNHYKYFLKGEKDNIQIPSSTGWSEMIRIFATQKEFGLIDTKSESIDRTIRKIKKDFNSRNPKPIYKVEKIDDNRLLQKALFLPIKEKKMYDNYFVTIAIMERKCNRYINIYYDMNFDSSSNQEEVLKIMDEKAEYFLQNYPKVECKNNEIGK